MKEEWLFPNAFVPVDVETTSALVVEIKRLIDVVGGMALAQPAQEPWCMKMNGCTTKCEDCPDEPAQEPVAWIDLQKEAQQIVESKSLWKRFIVGSPLANDIACWMADFALQHITPPAAQPAQEPVGVFCEDDDIGYVRLIPHQQMKLKAWDKLYTTPPAAQPAQRPWVGLTEAQFLEATRLAENGNYLVAFVRIQEWLKEQNA